MGDHLDFPQCTLFDLVYRISERYYHPAWCFELGDELIRYLMGTGAHEDAIIRGMFRQPIRLSSFMKLSVREPNSFTVFSPYSHKLRYELNRVDMARLTGKL